MDKYIIILLVLGIAMLGMAWMPTLTRRLRISYSIVYVLLGGILYTFLDVLPHPDPMDEREFTVRLTELVVIISLMGTGLKIDEPFSFKDWKIPLRLVSITMLLSIGAVALIAIYWLGLDPASAILLGAVLAPTDPVLADDVQVGPPLEKSKNEVRFTLTAEAGLNDGMAFPFTWLAITLALIPANEATMSHWFLFDLLYRIIMGLIMGFVTGKVLAYLIFTLPEKKKFLVTRDGFIAISTTLLVYAATEMTQGYGFIAVFVCAVTLRNHELEHEFHIALHSFTDQIERMLMAIVLVLFGGTLIETFLHEFNSRYFFFALMMVFLIRPLTALASMYPSKLHKKEKAAISFYGIKGIGSFFYLSFAIKKANFEAADDLWTLVSLIVFVSIIIHGFSANFVMGKIEQQFRQDRPVNKPKNA